MLRLESGLISQSEQNYDREESTWKKALFCINNLCVLHSFTGYCSHSTNCKIRRTFGRQLTTLKLYSMLLCWICLYHDKIYCFIINRKVLRNRVVRTGFFYSDRDIVTLSPSTVFSIWARQAIYKRVKELKSRQETQTQKKNITRSIYE